MGPYIEKSSQMHECSTNMKVTSKMFHLNHTEGPKLYHTIREISAYNTLQHVKILIQTLSISIITLHLPKLIRHHHVLRQVIWIFFLWATEAIHRIVYFFEIDFFVAH